MNLAQPAVFIAWPSAPLTSSLVHTSIAALGLSSSVLSMTSSPLPSNLIQWASYDCIDHALTASEPNHVLSSSYTIRKALIRKHFLARCIQSYLVKRPQSFLAKAAPLTWDIDIAYADELDEMWSDELWDLGSMLDANNSDIKRWFILKPGMTDRGMGIRLFDSKDALLSIFQEFDCDPDDEADETITSVMTSQLRHFVLQEYISTPLLVDPNEVPLSTTAQRSCDLRGYKFHLRTYVVASGALTVFMYERILALFSPEPYHTPMRSDLELTVSLTPHLTNTSLQTCRGEENVRLLDELIGCRVLSGGEESRNNVLNPGDVAMIKQQLADALSETFKAALGQPIHFQARSFSPSDPFGSLNSCPQPLPNAFELYGADFLVSHEPVGFQVKLMEMNSEPAIELTGPRLTWILEDLFKAIGNVCIHPFVRRPNCEGSSVSLKVGETSHNLRKCLDIKVHASMAC